MKLKSIILISIGFLCVTLGAIGVFFPVLPTTPFMILAAGCFSGSNKRFEEMLKKNKYFGSYIENYQNNTGIPIAAKKRAITFLWISLMISGLIIQKLLIIGILLVVGTAVTIHILSLKTME